MFEKNIHPYMGVSCDHIKEFSNGRKFRIILYSAYNARGLIGCENNGIAILDEDNLMVVVDSIAQQGTGYFGPSEEQLATFDDLIDMDWEEFRQEVNKARRLRRPI